MNLTLKPFGKRFPWTIVILALVAAIGLGLYTFNTARAAASLTIEMITWNVMGLDSNDVSSGPNNFPLGVRVCNNGSGADAPAYNVTSAFVWDSADSYINLRPLSYGTDGNPHPTIPELAVDACIDFYYEVTITRNAAAYDHKRTFHITASADGLPTVSTADTAEQEIYVERLISQSRNSNFNLWYAKLGDPLVAVPAGGGMSLYVGETYTIRLDSQTATNGYEQIETFINFPNTIFQVLSVASTYSAATGGGTTPTDTLYNDACTWISDPNDPNYRSCLSVGKAGGTVSNTYTIKIISGGGTSETLTNLIYDFSGSSYHYNSDYLTSYRIGNIIDPTSLTMEKSFVPATTNPNGVSALTITIHNPNAAPLSGLNFTDPLPNTPGQMTVASPLNFSTTGCGTPSFAPTAGATSLSFSNGSIAAGGYCVIKVNVTVPVVGIYTNTTNNLFVGTIDTGDNATANLVVNTEPPAPTPTCDIVIASWDFTGSVWTPSYQSPRVSSATLSYSYSGLGASAIDTTAGNPLPAWGVTGGWQENNNDPDTYPNGGAAPYMEIALDTTNYTGVEISFDYKVESNWANSQNNFLYVYSSANGATPFSNVTSFSDFSKQSPWASSGFLPAAATGSNTTAFRVNALGGKTGAILLLDNIKVYGCAVPLEPTLTKAFSPDPVAVNGISTLTFTLTNFENIRLTDVSFTDVLPAGLQVASTPNASTTCDFLTTTPPTWAPAAGSASLTFGSPNGGAIAPRTGATPSTCTVSVDVVATTPGPHQNVSGYIYTYETGTNNTATGYGEDSLTAYLPPVIDKHFSPNPIAVGETSTLSFVIANPNADLTITGVGFSDTFPANLVVANPTNASTTGCGTPTWTPTAGAGSVTFSGGEIPGGGTCVVEVDVTSATAGTYPNTTSTVTTTNAGTGNAASDTLEVETVTPAISLLKRVGTSASGPWYANLTVAEGGNVYYQFVIENTGDVDLTGITLSDPALTGFDPATCAWMDGNGASVTYPLSLPKAGLDDAHWAVCVYGAVTAAAGTHQNTATASVTYGTETLTDTSTAIYGTPALSIDKSVLETGFAGVGDVLHYEFRITNSGSTTLRAPISVSDSKIAAVSCPSLTSVVPDGDNYLDMGETILCSGTYVVTQADFDAGSITNIASAIATWATSTDTTSSGTDSALINKVPADYGDLPAAYISTYQTDNGARHTIGDLFIGTGVTADGDGIPANQAKGELDTLQDGVTLGGMWLNDAEVDINIDLRTSTYSGDVVAGIWIDWDAEDTNYGMAFIPCTGLSTGQVNVCKVTVPPFGSYTNGDPIYFRVRVFEGSTSILVPGGSLGAEDFEGLANNGEVEDYWADFEPTAVEMISLEARPNPSGLPVWAWLSAAALLLLGAGGLTALRVVHKRR